MITSSFTLKTPIQLGDLLQKMEEFGSIQRDSVIQNDYEFGVEFPDFEAAREFFGFVFERNVNFEIYWMVKGQNPYNEPQSCFETVPTT